MYKKLMDLFKDPEEFKTAKRIDVNAKRNKDFDFRGNRKDLEKPGQNMLGLRADRFQSLMEEHEPKMLARSVRWKSFGYLILFAAWNVGVIGFIMYRVRGDDLELLEKEAKERIQKSKINLN